MDPCKLTVRLTIQVNTPTQDAELNQVPHWDDYKTVWAEPLEKSSREFYRAATVNSEVTEMFRIRYTSGITAHQRIRIGTAEYLEIIGDPENEGRKNVSLLLTCKGAT
jgi:SPP1 family predicted phage head-tail adaptor